MNDTLHEKFPEAEVIFDQKDQQEIYAAAAAMLQDCSIDNPMSVKELEAAVQKRIPDKTKNSLIYVTILVASKHDSSRLRSKKGRGGGYYLIPKEIVEA